MALVLLNALSWSSFSNEIANHLLVETNLD